MSIERKSWSIAAGLLLMTLIFPARAADIVSPGPLTTVTTTPQLNCDVRYLGDSLPSFFEATACGTLVTVNGTLYGPASIPAGGDASPRTPWSEISQSAVSGEGSNASPFKVVTVVDGGNSGLRLTQTDSYVIGEDAYRTDVLLENVGAVQLGGIVYRAGDCFLQNSDFGFGTLDPISGAASCTASAEPDSRIEQFLPISAGSSGIVDFFSTVWSIIGQQLPFPNSCTFCAVSIDNGAGLRIL